MEDLVEMERSEFKALLIQNPNHFGTIVDERLAKKFPVVKPMKNKTKYEELTCVGFNPDLDLLEATVQVKLPYGYGGSLCGPGTTEYVRFFVDYGDGWEDVGLAAFNIHDIPDADDCADKPNKPLSYVVTLSIDPKRDFCGNPVLPRVRAVLSWESEPPAGDPYAPIVWGNALERDIQIKPRQWYLVDVVKLVGAQVAKAIKLPPNLEEIKLEPIPQPIPPKLKLAELAELYSAAVGDEAASEGEFLVEPHRFGFEELQLELTSAPVEPMVVVSKMEAWNAVGLDLTKVYGVLEQTSGDVSYEELNCLGLDYNREWLAATFRIKRPCGYSGDLCKDGSQEHIAFWADWDDTCEWTYLGTVSVRVHDIKEIPRGGLHYAALLPVDLTYHRRTCKKPKIGRVRAVLSWSTPPSTTDPDELPHWGNRLDTHVQIRPGKPFEPGKVYAHIRALGGIPIEEIDTGGDGMTLPTARFWFDDAPADGWGLNRDCPFGGKVIVHGQWFHGFKYRVKVRRLSDPPGTFQALTDSFDVTRWSAGSDTQTPDASGFFTYLNPALYFENATLAVWRTAGSEMWEVQLDIANLANVVLASTPWYRIQLDNDTPTAEITIDGGACDQYLPPKLITGKFVARDPHFGKFILDTLPASMSPPSPKTGMPPVSSGTSQTPVAGSAWELDSSGMAPCGYVVRVRVWDRTIRRSQSGHHNYNVDDKGFCLLKPEG